MPSVHLDEPYRLSLQKEALSVSTALLEGQVSVTEAVRALLPVLRELRLDTEAVFDLAGIDSELDGFPVGSVREHWGRKALELQDARRLAYEELVRGKVIECCRTLIARFGSGIN